METVDMDKRHRKSYEKALENIRNKETTKAIERLEEISKSYPVFYDARYKLGWQYLKLDSLEKAMHEFSSIYELTPAPDPKLALQLAELHEHFRQYDEAIDCIERLVQSLHPSDRIYQAIDRRFTELKFRKKAYTEPLDITIITLDSNINGPHGDYLPALNADGSIMIFTKRLPMGEQHLFTRVQEDLYMSYRNEEGEFLKAFPVKEINTMENEGAHCFSQDGRILIFTACNRNRNKNGCDLYISFNKDGVWSRPRNMGPEVNSPAWESQPSLSPDNKTLYFSSTRKGGYGKRDIWKVELLANGWSQAQNLGPVINSRGNESSPFIHADNETLYFRSDEHLGMGDYDIFLSKKTKDTWSKPINLGYPINTSANEGALFMELDGTTAYYSSDTHSPDNLDILSFEMPEHLRPKKVSYLKVKVSDAETSEPLATKIKLTEVADSLNTKTLTSDINGEAVSVLQTAEYLVNVNKQGYIFYSNNFKLADSTDLDKPTILDISLEPVSNIILNKKDKAFVLRNIFFESGSSRLLAKSEDEIENLAALLKNQNDIGIRIIGHTDNTGDAEMNQRLSEARAKAVHNALLEKQIDPSRLAYEGKGQSLPLADNSSKEGRAQNRRTEFVIFDLE